MDFEFEKEWQETLKKVESTFGEGLDLQAVLFLIGVQELGQGYRNFKKDEKVELLHIAICTLLQDYGYYEFIGRDEDDWPHFKRVKDLPQLPPNEQDLMMRKAVVNYVAGAF